MKYEKPEIAEVNSALFAVQAGLKGSSSSLDRVQFETIGAYEADE
jgi:hypothetical protein